MWHVNCFGYTCWLKVNSNQTINNTLKKEVCMFGKRKISLLAVGLALIAAPAMAGNLVAANCAGCHQSDGDTLWGTIVPGTQTDTTVELTTGNDAWKVRYDKKSTLESFSNVRELPDETAVAVTFKKEGAGRVYAEEISYKSSYDFHQLDNVITMSKVAQLLEKSPAEGNYMIVDARGYDNFIEGHLPNAVLIPYYEFQDFKDRMPADKDTLIVAYCRGFT